MSVPNSSGDKKGHLDMMELILQKNTKTIQQQGHCRILDVGSEAMRLLESQPTDNLSTWLAAEEALRQADEVHQNQMELALTRLRQEMEKDQALELLCQQQSYETMAENETKAFFQNMEARLERLDKELERAMADDLDTAVQEFDIGRREAVRRATTQLKTRLRNEFALEKERKIAENLSIARERFREKSLKTVRYIEEQSKKETKEILEQMAEEQQRTLNHFKEGCRALIAEIVKLEDSSFQLSLLSKDLSAEYQKLLNAIEGNRESNRPPMFSENTVEPSTAHVTSVVSRSLLTRRRVSKTPKVTIND